MRRPARSNWAGRAARPAPGWDPGAPGGRGRAAGPGRASALCVRCGSGPGRGGSNAGRARARLGS